MTKTLVIAHNSLRRLFRDRSNIFFVFVLPMVLILVLGLVFGSGFTTRVAIVVPSGDDRAHALYEEMADTTAFEAIVAEDEDAARRELRRNDIDAVIVIPDGYGDRLDAGENVEIGYFATVSAGGIDVQTVVEAAVARQATTVRAARFASDAAGVPAAAALEVAAAVGEQMPVVDTVVEGDTGDAVSGAADTNAAQQLLLFMFLTALASSTALIQSRRLGVSERMFSTPTSSGTIIGGETLGRFLVVMVQGMFIVLAAGALFGINWGYPPAAIAVVTAFALTGTGAGMLLGSTFANEQPASGDAIFGALVLAALGGSMVPLEIFPDSMLAIAHLTPHAWGNDAFATLILHNGRIPDIATELVVLTCYGLVLVFFAALVFRNRLTH